jgi:hypothetical protein
MSINKPENVKRFERLGEEKAALYARKNADYGNSFDKSLDEDGLLVLKIRLGDKFSRFCQLLKNPAQVTEEKLRETLIDLSNYADMGILWLDAKEEEKAGEKAIAKLNEMANDCSYDDLLDARARGFEVLQETLSEATGASLNPLSESEAAYLMDVPVELIRHLKETCSGDFDGDVVKTPYGYNPATLQARTAHLHRNPELTKGVKIDVES